MKIQVSHPLRIDVASAFKLCTDLKSQQSIYGQMKVREPTIKREGRAPNLRLKVSRKVPVNPPAALKKFVSGANEVSHTEAWRTDGQGYMADLQIDIRSVPVKIVGTKALRPEKDACRVEWKFDVTSGVPLLGSLIASFAGDEIRKSLEDEYKALKAQV